MAAALAAALEGVSGEEGWQIELVGGSRRKRPAAAAGGSRDTGAARAAAKGTDATPGAGHGHVALAKRQQDGSGDSLRAPAEGRAGDGLAAGSPTTVGGSSFIAGILAGRHHDADFMIRYEWMPVQLRPLDVFDYLVGWLVEQAGGLVNAAWPRDAQGRGRQLAEGVKPPPARLSAPGSWHAKEP